MVMALKQRNYTYKYLIIVFLTFCAVFVPTHDSLASNPTVIGFIIEAKQLEGTIQEPKLVVGNTTDEKERSMLELTIENVKSEDLIIKKLVKTPQGFITLQMTSKDTILLKNLNIKVTNAEFSEHYIPITGNIGLKQVKLLAHSITTDSSTLPQFNLDFHGNGQVEMEPKSKEELNVIKAVLDKLISMNPQKRSDA
jgi:hypothetical protein